MSRKTSINDIRIALNKLIIHHEKKFEDLDREHRHLYNKVINYHNQIKNDSPHIDFFSI